MKAVLSSSILFALLLASKTWARVDPHDLWRCHVYRPHRPRCLESQFNCRCETDLRSLSTDCIPRSWWCDGEKDCSDGSDEIDCICPSGQFQCGCDYGGGCPGHRDMYYCIPDHKVRNGKAECATERDEAPLLQEDVFRCPSGKSIPRSFVCNGRIECKGGNDEIGCSCPAKYPKRCKCNRKSKMRCKRGWICYSRRERCNGKKWCGDSSDEEKCESCPSNRPHRCSCNKFNKVKCRGKYPVCYKSEERCNAVKDCYDFSDEWGCNDCPQDQPHRCNCNKMDNFTCQSLSTCYSHNATCDGIYNCGDTTDELVCPCNETSFACGCFKSHPVTCGRSVGCISKTKVNDGAFDCPDKSDEDYVLDFNSVQCSNCENLMFKLSSVEDCNRIGFPTCDISTCTNVPSQNCTTSQCNLTDTVCTSHCSCSDEAGNSSKVLLCSGKGMIMTFQFCDGQIDCADGSDEVRNEPGFKCTALKSSSETCVLPQWNLFDDAAQCYDESDTQKGDFRFQCLDNRLIIRRSQVCDGTIDCYDLSDECLCYNSFRSPVCETMFRYNDAAHLKCQTPNPECSVVTGVRVSEAGCGDKGQYNVITSSNSEEDVTFITCQSKWGGVRARLCDGRPECNDFKDECSCSEPPAFCNDSCHSFFFMGDRYCDGYKDEAWRYINDTRCPIGFDETSCPMRFYCKAGMKISIDVLEVCDGITNCDDGSDESNCKNVRENIFSSDTEMISSPFLKGAIWFMGILTLCGNLYVLATTSQTLKNSQSLKLSEMAKLNHFLILNLCAADFMMGFYLLIIAIKSAQYRGNYGQFDIEWRSSLYCSAIGSIAVTSSETSCFLMAIMSAFRMYSLLSPFAARLASTKRWKVLVGISWLIAFILGVVPTLGITSHYFVQHLLFENPISGATNSWQKKEVAEFACRFASLTNSSISARGNDWESTTLFLKDKFPPFSQFSEIGYYGETSVCMPRFYVNYGDKAWSFSFVIITINFILFLYVLISYVLIYKRSSSRPIKTRNADKQNKKMQKRIARLLVTDFFCWIPICIMAYMKLGGVPLPTDLYIFSAAVLLPINSALNPVLYSPLLENLWEKLFRKRKSTHPSTVSWKSNSSVTTRL